MEIASRILCNLSDCVIAPTTKILDELHRYGVEKPIEVIPSGINLSAFRSVKKGYLLKKYGIKESDSLLLFVGRLGKEKLVDFILKSFVIIQKTCPDTKLVIVGDGTERVRLTQLAKTLRIEKSVIFTGYVPFSDIPKVYADADVFVFSSNTETQGLVILEAMASGLPIVAVSDPAFTDVIQSGKNGVLTSSSASDFSRAVIDVLQNENLKQSLINKAKKTVKRYSITTMGESHERLYKKMIAENQPKPLMKKSLRPSQFQFLQKLFSS